MWTGWSYLCQQRVRKRLARERIYSPQPSTLKFFCFFFLGNAVMRNFDIFGLAFHIKTSLEALTQAAMATDARANMRFAVSQLRVPARCRRTCSSSSVCATSTAASPFVDTTAVSTAYPFKEIERKWQHFWEQNHTFRTPAPPHLDTTKPKFYVCYSCNVYACCVLLTTPSGT